MNKYTRKQINKNASLHNKEFVAIDDVNEALMKVAKLAIECGADEAKMMEFFKGDGDE